MLAVVLLTAAFGSPVEDGDYIGGTLWALVVADGFCGLGIIEHATFVGDEWEQQENDHFAIPVGWRRDQWERGFRAGQALVGLRIAHNEKTPVSAATGSGVRSSSR